MANYFSSHLSVIDPVDRTILKTIPVDAEPYGVAVSADGRHVFVAHFPLGLVSMIETDTDTVVSTRTVGEGPRGIAASHDGTRLFLTDFFADAVSIIDVAQFG